MSKVTYCLTSRKRYTFEHKIVLTLTKRRHRSIVVAVSTMDTRCRKSNLSMTLKINIKNKYESHCAFPSNPFISRRAEKGWPNLQKCFLTKCDIDTRVSVVHVPWLSNMADNITCEYQLQRLNKHLLYKTLAILIGFTYIT